MELREELELRKYVQRAIRVVQERQQTQRSQEQRMRTVINGLFEEVFEELNDDEIKLRTVIHDLINEAKYDKNPEVRKRRSTGKNALADVLDKIVAELEIGYQSLTTAAAQRKSFRLHFIINLLNILETAIPSGGRKPEDENLFEAFEMEVDSDFLDDNAVETAEINRQQEEDGNDNEGKHIELEDSERTGRNYAIDTLDRLETNLLESYKDLANPSDRSDFRNELFKQVFLRFQTMTTNMTADLESSEYEAEVEDIKSEYKEFISGELTFNKINLSDL
jgi:uncharacterized protein YqgV (UPF0045/DUF77 family)